MNVVWGYTQLAGQRTSIDNRGFHSATTTKQAHLAAKCGNCGALSTAIVTGPAIDVPSSSTAGAILLDASNKATWFPVSVGSKEFPDVPAHVARCASEAYTAASVSAFMASILMARTTIEATAKSKSINDGSLYAKIDALAAQSLIRPAIREAAHAIRHLGNNMAHGDVEDAPTEQDANDVLRLMSMILTEVFEAAALTQAIMTRHSG